MKNKTTLPYTSWTKFVKGLSLVVQVCLILLICSVLFVGGVSAGFIASYIKDQPHHSYEELNNRINSIHSTGEAYFQDGTLIGELRSDSKLYPVLIDEISSHMINALLATEDNEFFEHQGVNLRGLSRAVREELTTPGAGSGGSTITQQLVKNQIVGSERSLDRKFREIALAIRVENMFEKDEILEAYLNIIYFGMNANGHQIEGIQAASIGIFGVDVSELNIAQSAYLSGMIQAPGRYTPFNRNGSTNESNLERGQIRARWVLERMLQTERTTEEEFNEASEYKYEQNLAEWQPTMLDQYPFLTFTIEDRVTEIIQDIILKREGKDREDFDPRELQKLSNTELSRGGYKIYTTIDQELYDAFHKIADEHNFGPRSSTNTYQFLDAESGEEKERGYLEQAAATLLDNETGAILAMLEGRDYHESNIDLTNRPFQPGSSIKPILDYGPALEAGLLQPASPLDDVPLFDYGDYPPMNFHKDFRGLGSVREYIKVSQNIPAIQAFRENRKLIGTEGLFEYSQKLGLKYISEAEMSYDSTAIGGLNRGWTVEEGTAAYSTFANEGGYRSPYMIQRIETMEGEVVYEHQSEVERVFSKETAFLMNDMLRDVVQESGGTANRIIGGQLISSSLDIAGKTGTTDEMRDYWFIGYTPQVSLGLWFGYQNPESLADGYTGRHQTLWVKLFEQIQKLKSEHTDSEQTFIKPATIQEMTVCSKSGKLPSDLCRQRGYLITDYFNLAFVPTERDDVVVRLRTTRVGGTTYIANSRTPNDFINTGQIYIQRKSLNIPTKYASDRSKWLPDDWDNRAPTERDPRRDNGKTPSTPKKVEVHGSTLSWNTINERDVVGYRIYRKSDSGFNHIGSVTGTRHSISNRASEYYVTAVDIVGRESGRSSVSSNPIREQEKKNAAEEKKEMEQEKIAEEEKKEEEKIDEEEKKKEEEKKIAQEEKKKEEGQKIEEEKNQEANEANEGD